MNYIQEANLSTGLTTEQSRQVRDAPARIWLDSLDALEITLDETALEIALRPWSITIVDAPDANGAMKHRDREGAPWVPLCPLVSPKVDSYDSTVLDHAMRVTLRRINDCGWPGNFLAV